MQCVHTIIFFYIHVHVRFIAFNFTDFYHGLGLKRKKNLGRVDACFHFLFIDRDQYQLGTLSHILNNKTTGYKDLPEWPEEAPDSSVRNVEVPVPQVTSSKSGERKKPTKERGFYSESESSSEGNPDEIGFFYGSLE